MKRKAPRPTRFRVPTPTPIVYLGPDARPALEEGRGVLLGAQRPGWVDAVRFRSVPTGTWTELVEQRFCSRRALQPVGIVVESRELRRQAEGFARELVPGDVVLAVPVRNGKPRAYVNRGDRLTPTRLKISRID